VGRQDSLDRRPSERLTDKFGSGGMDLARPHRLSGAHRLDERLVREARKRLSRWRKSDAIHPHWADEWDRVLEMPVGKIAKLISSNSERARELRQSSPFAGVLTEQERRRVVRMVEDRVSA
jgi:hypothetical protein